MHLKSLATGLFFLLSGIICAQDAFLPPDSLHVIQRCDEIQLEWSAPHQIGIEMSGYHVYLSDSLLAFTIDTSYQIHMQGNGLVTFNVTTVYNEDESVPASIEVELVTYAPATNLTYNFEECEFSWSPPAGNLPVSYLDSVDILQWCEDYNHFQIGTGSSVEFDVAARWEPTQLSQYGDGPLFVTEIDFFPYEPSAQYRVRIWQGEGPDQMIYEQEVTDFQIEQWNHVVLSDSILVNINQELWIGYNINTPTGYPAGCDDGPVIDGYGNMINFGGWQTLLQLNPSCDYNWNIKAEIQYTKIFELTYDIIGHEPCGWWYHWYKVNDWPIADTSYWYACILPEHRLLYNEYFVQVNYCNVLINSDTVDLNICWASKTDQDGSASENPINIYQTGQEWIINADVELTQISIYDLTGRVVFKKECDLKELRINHQSFPPGIYLINATTDSGRYSRKIIK
jgi:hypothetical protein